jgi:hypothetical protein
MLRRDSQMAAATPNNFGSLLSLTLYRPKGSARPQICCGVSCASTAVPKIGVPSACQNTPGAQGSIWGDGGKRGHCLDRTRAPAAWCCYLQPELRLVQQWSCRQTEQRSQSTNCRCGLRTSAPSQRQPRKKNPGPPSQRVGAKGVVTAIAREVFSRHRSKFDLKRSYRKAAHKLGLMDRCFPVP